MYHRARRSSACRTDMCMLSGHLSLTKLLLADNNWRHWTGWPGYSQPGADRRRNDIEKS